VRKRRTLVDAIRVGDKRRKRCQMLRSMQTRLSSILLQLFLGHDAWIVRCSHILKRDI
jgi:hypothetical protein